MTSTTPVTWASSKEYLLTANETAGQGQATAGAFTQLFDSFKPKDVPVFLKDKSKRGSMGTDSFAVIPGVKKSTMTVGGPVYCDGLPYWLRNIMGDLAVTGTPTGSGATTIGSAGAAAGASSIPSVASIPAGTVLQIGTGATAEACTTGTPTGSGPYVIPLANGYALAYAHAAGQALTPITGPYKYVFSLLNSGSGQPLSQTLTHYLGTTATSGARQYPGCCMSDLSFVIKPDSALFTWTGSLTGYPSVPLGSQPTPNATGTLPIAAWETAVGIGGPASGGTLVKTPGEITIALKRELEVYYTSQGSQSPFIIQRGGMSTTANKMMFPAVADESPLNYMLNNTQPQVQVLVSNGGSGTGLLAVQFDYQTAAFTTAEPDTTKAAVGYSTGFEGVFNTTNAGGSGGFSPLTITVTNNVTPGSY